MEAICLHDATPFQPSTPVVVLCLMAVWIYAHLMDSPLRAGVDAVAGMFRPRPKIVHDADAEKQAKWA